MNEEVKKVELGSKVIYPVKIFDVEKVAKQHFKPTVHKNKGFLQNVDIQVDDMDIEVNFGVDNDRWDVI